MPVYQVIAGFERRVTRLKCLFIMNFDGDVSQPREIEIGGKKTHGSCYFLNAKAPKLNTIFLVPFFSSSSSTPSTSLSARHGALLAALQLRCVICTQYDWFVPSCSRLCSLHWTRECNINNQCDGRESNTIEHVWSPHEYTNNRGFP